MLNLAWLVSAARRHIFIPILATCQRLYGQVDSSKLRRFPLVIGCDRRTLRTHRIRSFLAAVP